MKNLAALTFATALVFAHFSCKKESPAPVDFTTEWPGQMVEASFAGRVLDEKGQPLARAAVRVGTRAAETDANGVFVLEKARVNSARAVVTVFKAGFWRSARTLFVQPASHNLLIIKLLEKKAVAEFSAKTGATVAVEGGAEIAFEPNSIVRDGQLFDQKVLVAARWLDPTDSDLAQKLPASLRGQAASGTETGLATFGMLAVELTDDAGRPVELAAGKKAKISMPIPAQLEARAAARIALWHFSEIDGRWLEDGEAEKVGSSYVGSVAHFSWWNCDAPFPTIKLKISLQNASGGPLGGYQIALKSPVWGYSYAQTNAAGVAEGLVPKGEIMKFEVFAGQSFCAGPAIFAQSIGPFSADAELGPIAVPASATVATATISGQLTDCAGQPLGSAYLLLDRFFGQAILADSAGFFSKTFYYCSSDAPAFLTFRAVDLVKMVEKRDSAAFSATMNLGKIEACAALGEFIRYQIDSQPEVILVPNAPTFSANFVGILGFAPSGTFGMSWEHSNAAAAGLAVNYLSLEKWTILPAAPYYLRTDMTAFPTASGQFLEGSFSGIFPDTLGPMNIITRSLSGSYRVKRL